MFSFFRIFFFSLVLLTVSGCSDSLIAKIQILEPEIIVHPIVIDFENLSAGEESGHSSFSIINVGNEPLYIDQPVLDDNTTRFQMSGVSTTEILPGELVDVEVYYTPQTYESSVATVRVFSNDDVTPQVEVLLLGSGDAPVITLEPEGHDFGTISIGCDNELRLTVGNDGNVPLEIADVQQMVTQPVDIGMSFGSLPELPWTIEPGYELDIITAYNPSDVGDDASIITITSNDPMSETVDFDEVGVGQIEEWVTDIFEQEEVPLLDILWVIDNSGSMSLIQDAVATNMSDFMSIFLAASPDYHMAFITTDSEEFEGGMYLDSSTQSPDVIAGNIVISIGIRGSSQEKGIYYSYLSTINPLHAGAGGAFLRDDATLVVIYVSDEPDFSEGGWSNYTNHFDNLKSPDKLHMVAVVPDDATGCYWTSPANPNYTRYLQPGLGYIDIADYYGGDFYSICAIDWGAQMQDLAETVSSKRAFVLSEDDPIEDTIKIYVNGQEVGEDVAEYDSTENHVAFSQGSEPDPGDTIEVAYALWGCE